MTTKDPLKKKAANAKWRNANIEKARKSWAAWAKANPEKIKANTAERYKNNPDKQKAASAAWDKANPGKATAKSNKRRSAKLQRTPAWLTPFDLLKIKCIYQVAAMRTRESGEVWHVDHIIPLQGKNVSGLHVPSNLQIIRGVENLKKNAQFNS
jgi:hypothetical protein